MKFNILSKFEKVQDIIRVIYDIISELVKFVDFIEGNDTIGDIGNIKEKIPTVKKSLGLIKTAIEFVAKIFKIEINQESTQVLSTTYENERLAGLNEQIEDLMYE